MAIAKLKKDDSVTVLAGKDKGKIGVILKIDVQKGKALVKGINMVHKCQRRKTQEDKGGIIQQEALISLSNLAFWDAEKNTKVSVGVKTLENGKRVRFNKGSGEIIEDKRDIGT